MVSARNTNSLCAAFWALILVGGIVRVFWTPGIEDWHPDLGPIALAWSLLAPSAMMFFFWSLDASVPTWERYIWLEVPVLAPPRRMVVTLLTAMLMWFTGTAAGIVLSSAVRHDVQAISAVGYAAGAAGPLIALAIARYVLSRPKRETHEKDSA